MLCLSLCLPWQGKGSRLGFTKSNIQADAMPSQYALTLFSPAVFRNVPQREWQA